jgi:hypothetical protein
MDVSFCSYEIPAIKYLFANLGSYFVRKIICYIERAAEALSLCLKKKNYLLILNQWDSIIIMVIHNDSRNS